MSRTFFRMQLPIMIVVSIIMIGLVAWKEDGGADSRFNNTDTVPKKERKVRNLDDALQELDRGQAELEESIKKLDKDFVVPVPPIAPIPSIDVEKMKADIEKALKAVEPEKIKKEIEQSMKHINPEEIKATVAEAMKEIDAQKINAQVQASLAKINMEEIKIEMEALKVEIPKLQEELKNLKPQIEESMKKAKEEIAKAKVEIQEFKTFEEGLENDGLINRKATYTIEHRDEKLYIDGKQQPESVYNKYRNFLNKHENFTLKKTDDDFQLKKN